jgi:glycosyltransferase 2 family protein
LRWAVGGWALTFFMIVLLAVRWRLFLQQQQVEVRFPTLFGLTWAGQFFNSILPGSTGGDVVKIYQLCRMVPDRKAAAAASILADRLTALIVLVAFAATSFLLEPVPLQAVLRGRLGLRSMLLTATGLIVAGVATSYFLWLFLRRTSFAARIRRVFIGVRQCFSWNRRLAGAFVLALALHSLNFSIVFLFARSLGLTLTYSQALLMMPVILFLVMIPVTINGHGLRELLLIAYLSAMNVTVASHPEFKTLDTAVALSLLTVANDLLWSLPGGLWYLTKFRTAQSQPK